MLQTAVFVDAGYLHAQGSALLAGSAQRRDRNRLNVPLVLADLATEAKNVEPAARLLRIYWYDGLARGGTLSLEQRTLAASDNVKCRFGVINSRGQQKGVDSLIVSDLIQLAREGAFSDALILAGDEDLRVGVQVAQTFGIRVHVIGIHPARGSQSPDLLAEADTTHEWGKEKVEAWLSVITAEQGGQPDGVAQEDAVPDMKQIAAARVSRLDAGEAAELVRYMDQNKGQVPPDFDRPALGAAKSAFKRDLTPEERKEFRVALREALRQTAAQAK